MEKNTKTKESLKEWLISLAITLVLLGVVMGGLHWFTATTGIQLVTSYIWISNAVGGVLMLLLVHHFVKKPRDEEQGTQH